MCLGLCQCVIEFLPYMSVVLLPVLGAFLGAEAVLRVSIILCLHSLLVSLVPKEWVSALPFVQISFYALLAVLPLMWLPWPLVWVYSQLLWLTEPMLLVAEVVLVQNIVMRCGQYLAEKIDYEENTTVSKGIIIIFSASCYAVAASAGWEIYKSNTPLQNGFLLVVALLFLAVHNMFWMAREGVISDVAFCTLCMVAVLGAMSVETQQIRQPLPTPLQWFNGETSRTKEYDAAPRRAVDLIISILTMHSAAGSRGVSYLLNVVITPFFLLSLAFRLYSIIFIVSKVTKNFFQTEEEQEITILNEDDILDPMAPWRSPVLLKLSIILMLTQLTVLFLWQASGQYLAGLDRWMPFSQQVWPQQVMMGRLVQIGSVCGFYIWRLYCADAWIWCEWLTP
ncbi:uncharacterized protein [Littorina saxatilis]|uniref:Uncharacterized protein n=1 Tax=Littorina saxatilis TaxID=31220 RepID=A0AAN9AHZ6_9CAEN